MHPKILSYHARFADDSASIQSGFLMGFIFKYVLPRGKYQLLLIFSTRASFRPYKRGQRHQLAGSAKTGLKMSDWKCDFFTEPSNVRKFCRHAPQNRSL